MPSDTTTTSTTPLVPPLPSEFEATLPKVGGTLCDELTKAGTFDAKFAKFYRWMFKDDGTFSDAFMAMICAIDCSGTGGGTGTTTAGTGSTTTVTTTVSQLSWANKQTLTNASCCCISDDGQVMAVGDLGGFIWVSTDGGNTWAQRATSQNWTGICCSSDGTKMYACGYTVPIHVSTDSGATWSASSSLSYSWANIKCNADGSKVYCAGFTEVIASTDVSWYGRLTTSVDSGSTWAITGTPLTGFRFTIAPTVILTISNDGNVMLLGFQNYVMLSLDGGASFVITTLGNQIVNWATGAASANNGTVFYVLADNNLFTSTDGGGTWTQVRTQIPALFIACSQNGTRVEMVTAGTRIMESFDSGVTLIPEDAARLWKAIACNPDGTKSIAVAKSAGIYIGT